MSIRGAQSAGLRLLRQPGRDRFRDPAARAAPPRSNLLAEGGSHYERRFAITGTGTIAGFGLLVSASRYDTDGLVANNDYRNEECCSTSPAVSAARASPCTATSIPTKRRQPGAWGSDPKHTFGGFDTDQPRQEQLLRVRRALRSRPLAARAPGIVRQLLSQQQRLPQPVSASASTRTSAGRAKRAPSSASRARYRVVRRHRAGTRK